MSGVFPGQGTHGLPQLGIQSWTHISLSAGFGSIISPVLAESTPFPWLPGELVAVAALLSSLMACAQLLPLPLPSIHSFGCFPFKCPLGTENLLLSIAKKKRVFSPGQNALLPSLLPRCPLVGFSLEADGNGKGGKKGLFLLPGSVQMP